MIVQRVFSLLWRRDFAAIPKVFYIEVSRVITRWCGEFVILKPDS